MRSTGILIAGLIVAAIAALTIGASAAGPGGWDRLGEAGTPGNRTLDGVVRALNTEQPGVLLLGGAFTNAGGIADADRIATWNGSTWGAVGPGLGGDVFAIAYHDGKVFAGGTFTNAGNNPNADFLAVWDGASWKPFCDPGPTGAPFEGAVHALQIIGSKLYVGGTFQDGAGIERADYLVACELATGASTPLVSDDGDGTGSIYDLTADSNGVLYAVGPFINMDQIPAADYIAAWDGASWHALGSGPAPALGAVTDIARSVHASGSDVYIGADADNIGQIPQADNVARWDGGAWHALGADSSGGDGWFPSATSINSITTAGSQLFVIGSFQNGGGEPTADVIASFENGAWHPVGSDGAGNGPLNPNGQVVHPYAGRLYAGGSFTSAGGDPSAQFAASYSLTAPPVVTPTVTPGPTPVATPVVTPTPPPPPPKLGSTLNAAVEKGTVLVSLPAAGAATHAAKFIPLTAARQVPLGSTFDTSRGTVRLTFAAKKPGTTQSGSFSLGKFKTAQSKRDALVTLTTTGAGSLLSKIRGNFRTRGRNSTTTGRSTTWLQKDSGAGTLTQVRAGSAVVRDLAKRKNVVVKKGKRYLARRR